MDEMQLTTIDEKKKSPTPVGNFYNLYMLIEPTLTIDEIYEFEENIKKLIEKFAGTIKKADKFIKKDLAYPIKKLAVAYIGSVYFFMPSEKITELQKHLKELPSVLMRFSLTKTSPKLPDKNPISADMLKAIDEELEKIETKTKEKVGIGIESEKISTEKPQEEKNRVTIEDIDKKLDEIMGSL